MRYKIGASFAKQRQVNFKPENRLLKRKQILLNKLLNFKFQNHNNVLTAQYK